MAPLDCVSGTMTPSEADRDKARTDVKNCLALGNVMCPSLDGNPTCMTAADCMSSRPVLPNPVDACPDGKFSCKSGCESAPCTATAASLSICPPRKPTLCPDQLNCAESMEACANMVEWNGCPLGKAACPARRIGRPVCVSSLTECAAQVGCATTEQLCGFDRTNMTGAPAGAPGKPICAVTCSVATLSPLSTNFKPAPTTLPAWTPSDANLSQEVVTGDKKAIFRMSAPKGVCQSAASSSSVDLPINFAITPVADSDVTDGPFKAFADKMLSPLINVQPDTLVAFNSSDPRVGVTLEFPLLDAALQGISAAAVDLCTKVLAKSKVISYSDDLRNANVATAMQESTFCSRGDQLGEYSCVCKVRLALSRRCAHAVGRAASAAVVPGGRATLYHLRRSADH